MSSKTRRMGTHLTTSRSGSSNRSRSRSRSANTALRSRSASAWQWPKQVKPLPPTCSRTPTSPCTPRSWPAGVSTGAMRRRTEPSPTMTRVWRRTSPGPSSAVSCVSTISRSWTSAPARSRGPKRWSAGSIRNVACSRPAASSRSPNEPAASSRSARGSSTLRVPRCGPGASKRRNYRWRSTCRADSSSRRSCLGTSARPSTTTASLRPRSSLR